MLQQLARGAAPSPARCRRRWPFELRIKPGNGGRVKISLLGRPAFHARRDLGESARLGASTALAGRGFAAIRTDDTATHGIAGDLQDGARSIAKRGF